MVVYTLKAFGYIGFNCPFHANPVVLQAFQCGVATSFWTEAVTIFVKDWLVDGFKYQPNTFLDGFVAWRRHSQRTLFAIGFWDVDSPDRGRLVVVRFE